MNLFGSCIDKEKLEQNIPQIQFLEYPHEPGKWARTTQTPAAYKQ